MVGIVPDPENTAEAKQNLYPFEADTPLKKAESKQRIHMSDVARNTNKSF